MSQLKNINIIYNDKEFPIEVEDTTTYEDLQILVFSVTDVEPTLQRYYFLSKSPTQILSPFEKINVLNNQKILLLNLKNLIISNNKFQPSFNNTDSAIRGKVENMFRNMMSYNSDKLQQLALDAVPLEIKKEKEPKKKMLMLLNWFKNDYFSWMNSPECSDQLCGTPSTKLVGVESPTQIQFEYIKGQASRIEVYKCDTGHITKFPRYNSVEKLLETKSGRCGEWANAFTLFCMALGFTTRYIYDLTDHVWNEVFIDNRWIHVDSCEEAYDKPLTYEGGWGKQLSYIFAFELDGVYDVTNRYTLKLQQLKRVLSTEDNLSLYLDSLNHKIRLSLPFDILRQVLKRESLEQLESATYHTRQYNKDEQTGRVSGSSEWRSDRGELGTTTAATTLISQEVPTISKSIYSLDSISKAKESLNLVGDCEITRNGICLTPDATDRIGGFWLKNKVDCSNGFICKIKFLIKTSGADGMAFVIQNHSQSALGIGGCGLGYQGIPNSLAIEFDTYPSKDHCKDPDGNHISINTRGRDPNSAHHRFSLGYGNPLNNKSMNDGTEHECFIKYSATDNTINVWLDKHQILHDIKVDLSNLLQLESNKFSYIGMTAATGGLKQTHIISGFSIGN